MLIQFVAENFLSFKDETVFNLIATSDKRHPDHINRNNSPNIDILKIAAVYGANASGKSNLINTIEFARDFIIFGTRGDETISTIPFRLDSDCINKPSKFQFLFCHKNQIYDYGFVVGKNQIYEEWLFIKSNRNFKRMYERITTKAGKNKYEFGPSLVRKTSKKKYLRYSYEMEGTRVNQLFLTEAFNRNIHEIDPVMNWFKYTLVILSPNSRYSALELRAKQDKKFNKFLCQLLKIADTGIENVSTDIENLDFNKQFPDMPENIEKQIKDSVNNDKGILISDGEKQYAISKTDDNKLILVKLKMQHKGKDDILIDFKFDEESEGTQRLIHLAPAFADLLESEKVYFIDELDRRLHPNLSKSLIELYLELHIKKKNRQLIFVTHESNLLDLNYFRRDEIWFVEKDKMGTSHISSLSDFKIRSDLNVKNGYLKGRFGAIPFIGDIERLGWIK